MKHNSYKKKYKVIKILLTLIILLSFSPKILHAKNNVTCKLNEENQIEKITVKVYKNKNWTKNNIRILISNTRTIPKKLRKRFKGELKVQYTSGSLCVLKAKVRQNGDFKDHFIYINNNIKQSLDVELTNGNLGGITNFKLLLDGTRGSSQDEIFLTELLRELNFISPRTQFVEAYVNEMRSTMLIQEKSTKEMLEYHGKIESAIFETNENDFFKSLEKFVNNNLTSDEIGLNASLEKAKKGQLARQINGKWSLKSPMHLEISLRALSNLNLVYINSLNNFNQNSNNNTFNDNLDNTLLGKQNKKNIIKLDKYYLVLKATNADHALEHNNRTFYWHKLENYFEPIYYDGNPLIYKNDNIEIDLPVSSHLGESLEELEKSLINIDLETFKKKLSNRKLNFTNQEIQEKMKIINFNLSRLRTAIDNLNSDIISAEREKKIDQSMMEEALVNKKENNSGALFVFKEIDQDFNNHFLLCKNYNHCEKIKLNKEEQSKMLSGNLFQNNQEYIYVGYYPDLKIKSEIKKFNFVSYRNDDVNFYYNDGIKFNFDKEKKEFNIFQFKPEARAYFINSKLKNLNINFNGYKNFNDLKFFPFDLKGLTGCLTFFKSNFENVNLKAQDSNCEDSLNLVNVNGKINNIVISNSYSDALDIDFSNINIKNIVIKNSKNDCVDVSAGIYNFEFLDLDNCGDKGLSVGEKSKINIKNINVNNSELGIASKDGSIANIFNVNIQNVDTCLGSYNKKKEFSGGYIKINAFNCINFIKENILDSQSRILLEN